MMNKDALSKIDTGWYGTNLQSEGVPMVDEATGRPFVLREFSFAFKKLDPSLPFPTKQQLFNAEWPRIKTIIWGDGLVANTDVDPRVVVGKKRYRIFILCEPKFRTMIVDRPTTLQDIFKKNGQK